MSVRYRGVVGETGYDRVYGKYFDRNGTQRATERTHRRVRARGVRESAVATMSMQDQRMRGRFDCGTLAASVIAIVLGALVFITSSATAHAQTDAEPTLERRVKAAFLYRYTEFVSWPDAAFARSDSPFVIAVIGRDAMVDDLRNIAGTRTVAGHMVEVRRATEADSAPPAHLIFIADAEKPRLRELLRNAPRYALTVTEVEGALSLGSMINFVIVEGRVRFEIALDNAEKRGLRLSSRLLAVAHAVRAGNP
jgi:hypothetical protein